MFQPNYTWWPWRVLAATVGLVSGVMVVTWMQKFNMHRERDLLEMALAVFAGGNALILGMSIGDLGRTILTLLLSIGVASLFSLAPVDYSLLAPLVIMPVLTASLSIDRSLFGFAASGYLGFRSALIGSIAYGVAWLFSVWIVWLMLGRRGDPALLAVPVACALGNAVMVGLLFHAARRAQGVPSKTREER